MRLEGARLRAMITRMFTSETARDWLARHRLPADGGAVGFVSERLAARRRGRAVEAVLVGAAAVAIYVSLRSETTELWVIIPIASIVAVDVGRRWLLWRSWDRRLLAELPVRMASLSPPAWDDLVGRRALVRAGVLLAAGLGYALVLFDAVGTEEAVVVGAVVIAAAAHAGALIELARRRPMVAGDVAALAVNDRLRGEEANHAATVGFAWIFVAPWLVEKFTWQATLLAFLWFLFVISAVRHRYAYHKVDGQLVSP